MYNVKNANIQIRIPDIVLRIYILNKGEQNYARRKMHEMQKAGRNERREGNRNERRTESNAGSLPEMRHESFQNFRQSKISTLP